MPERNVPAFMNERARALFHLEVINPPSPLAQQDQWYEYKVQKPDWHLFHKPTDHTESSHKNLTINPTFFNKINIKSSCYNPPIWHRALSQ